MIDKMYIVMWLSLAPLAIIVMMVFIEHGICGKSLLVMILFGFPQFILLSFMPLAEWYDNKSLIL